VTAALLEAYDLTHEELCEKAAELFVVLHRSSRPARSKS